MEKQKKELNIIYEFDDEDLPTRQYINVNGVTPIMLMSTMAQVIEELSNSKECHFDKQAFIWLLYDNLLKQVKKLDKNFLEMMLKTNMDFYEKNYKTKED